MAITTDSTHVTLPVHEWLVIAGWIMAHPEDSRPAPVHHLLAAISDQTVVR